MIILMLSQVIGSMENGNDDDEPGNRIFAERDPNDHSDAEPGNRIYGKW